MLMRLLLWFGGLILIVAVLLGAAIGYLSTQSGRTMLAGQIERFASTDDRTLKLGPITGSLFSRFNIGSVQMADGTGAWLNVKNISVDWAPIHLLTGRQLRVLDLSVDEIAVDRRPLADASRSSTDDTGSSGLPVAVDIETMSVGEVKLGERVVGVPARFNLAGRTAIRSLEEPVFVLLTAQRTDGIKGDLKLEGTFNPATEQLDLDLEVSEAADGVLANMLDLQQKPALSLSVKGDGVLRNWQGDLKFTADNSPVAQGTLSTRYENDGLDLDVSLSGNVSNLSPRAYAELLSGNLNLRVQSRTGTNGVTELSILRLNTDAINISAQGSILADGVPDRLSADISLKAPDGRVLKLPGSRGISLSGADVTVDVSADGDNRSWSARGNVSHLGLSGGGGEAVSLTAKGSLIDFDNLETLRVPFEANLTVDGPVLQGDQLRQIAGSSVSLTAKGEALGSGDVKVSSGRLSNWLGDIDYTADYASGMLEATAETAVADLAPLADIVDRSLGGGISANIQASSDLASGQFDITLSAQTSNLTVGIQAVDNLFAGTGSLSGQVSGNDNAAVTLSGVSYETAGLRLTADGSVAAGQLDLTVETAVANLSVINPDVTGALDLVGKVTGAVSAPDLDVTLTSSTIDLAGNQLDDLQMDLTAKADPANPEGSFDLSGSFKGSPLQGKAGIGAGPDGDYTVESLSFSGAGLTADGQAQIGPDGIAKGQIAVKSDDLTDLGALLLLDLGGALTADVTLSDDQGKQLVSIDANGSNMTVSGATIASLALKGTVADALGAPRADGTVAMKTIVAGGTTIDTIDGTARSEGAATDFTLDAALGPSSISSAGVLTPENGAFVIDLSKATLTHQSLSAALAEPAQIAITEGVADIRKARWKTGNGSVGVTGKSDDAIDVAIDQFPLELVNSLMPSLELEGLLSGTSKVNLAAAEPDVTWDLSAEGTTVPLLAENNVNALNVKSTGSFSAGTAQYQAILTNSQGINAEIDGSAKMPAPSIEARINATVADLDALKALAGRTLGGRVSVHATASADLSNEEFKIDLSGETEDLTVGISQADSLLKGEGRLSGSVSGTGASAITLSGVSYETAGLRLTADGSVAADQLDLTVETAVANLSVINPDVTGALDLVGKVTGAVSAPDLDVTLTSSTIDLAGNQLDDLQMDLTAKADPANPEGSFDLSGSFKGSPLQGKAGIGAGPDGDYTVESLSFSGAGLTADGQAQIGPDGIAKGQIAVKSDDLTDLGALLLLDLGGALTADVTLSDDQGKQLVSIDANGSNMTVSGATIASLALKGTVADALGAPRADGTVAMKTIVAGGTTIDTIDGTARSEGAATDFTLDAALGPSSISSAGVLTPENGAFVIDLSKATLTHQSLSAVLAEPAQIAITEGVADIRKARWKTGNGSVGVTGKSDDAINVRIQNFPLNLVNAFAPGLGLTGQLSGTSLIDLASGGPVAKWDVSVSGASVPAASKNGVSPLGVKSTGDVSGGRIQYTATVTNSQGINVTLNGSADPQGPSVDARVKGNIPLNIVDRVPTLAARGIGLTGTLVADLSVKGGAPMPDIVGTLSVTGGSFRDARDGISISALTFKASVNKTALTIQTLTGRVNDTGSLNVSGSVDLDPTRYFPADLAIKMTDGRFVDEQLLSTTFSADLTVKGPVATTPALAGRIDINRMDIQIPDLLPGGYSDIKINHINAPAAVVRQEREINGEDGSGSETGPPFNASLSLVVSAPARIFVRGRGLDAEMGGEIRISGTTNAPVIVGGFSMRRGRLGIFGKNLVFERGEVTFSGDLDPELDFVTTTNAADTTIFIRVNGLASNPNFSFSSSPELPQDEVLALLLFNRSLDQLSTAQIATLAAQVAALTGSGPGILGSVRQSLGVDVLDLTTDERGNAAVEAGKYLNDNIYLGVKQAGESSSVTVDIDITRNLKGRGEVDARGDSKLGFEFNYDY